MVCLSLSGCSNEDTSIDPGHDNDSAADTDTGTGPHDDGICGSTADCSDCTDPVCISTIRGRVEDQDGNPLPGTIQICIPACTTTPIEDNGDFCLELDECWGFDFDGGDKMYATLFENADNYTRYSVGFRPTQEEISDQGVGDFTFEVGTLKQFELPDESATYTSTGGAEVSDLDGVSFSLAPGVLTCPEDAASCELKAFEFPLEQWVPPFVEPDLGIEGLYYLHPYLHEVQGGVVLTIDPATSGWTGSDTGTVYLLGDYANHFVNCGDEDLPIGWLAPCRNAAVQDGEIVTEPLPFLGFIGLSKN